jgi:DNA-binding NarL/FixJ family response regulator
VVVPYGKGIPKWAGTLSSHKMTGKPSHPMRQWSPEHSNTALSAVEGLIASLGEPAFESNLLQCLQPVVPAASYSMYRTGSGCAPKLYMSSSLGVPDTTRDCWHAYLSGPYQHDRTLMRSSAQGNQAVVCHFTAQEAPPEHRQRVYEAHGLAERVSVVHQEEAASVFAINFYRHVHQRPFTDRQLSAFGEVASGVLAIAHKQLALIAQRRTLPADMLAGWAGKLTRLNVRLTAREIEVCTRILMGLTNDGIATDLGLSLPTVKTFRNRAFAKLGIHFRNELFALLHAT